jgi:hypothetical protein
MYRLRTKYRILASCYRNNEKKKHRNSDFSIHRKHSQRTQVHTPVQTENNFGFLVGNKIPNMLPGQLLNWK